MPSLTREKWTCSHTIVIIIFTGAVAGLFAMAWGMSKDPPELKNLKYFGLGKGPTFLNTFNTSGLDLNKGLYEEYFGYKRVVGQISAEEKENYKAWYTTNKCQGGCSSGQCSKGLCWCDEGDPSQYGQCRPKSGAKYLGNEEKFRKPELPALPDKCYITKEVDGRMQKVTDDLQAHKPECHQKVSYPDVFDLETQACDITDSGSCLDRDMNLVCGEMGKCQCRQDMKWNEDHMQCELYLGVDCSDVSEVDINSGGNKEIEGMILGRVLVLSTTTIDKEKTRTVYCNLLEVHSKEHVKRMRGGREEPNILGFLNTIGVIFFGAGCCFGVMWLIMIYGLCRHFVRSLDPRNVMMDNLTTGEKIAALGAVAGQEMVERQEEVKDERKAALMQGQRV